MILREKLFHSLFAVMLIIWLLFDTLKIFPGPFIPGFNHWVPEIALVIVAGALFKAKFPFWYAIIAGAGLAIMTPALVYSVLGRSVSSLIFSAFLSLFWCSFFWFGYSIGAFIEEKRLKEEKKNAS